MCPFDIHAWRQKQLFTQSSDKDTIGILAEIYMANLTKNKLYENISPQHYNQLRENIFKKLKAKFLDFSDDVKTNVKNIVSKLGKEGLSSLQKIASKFPKFTKSSDLLFRIRIAQNLSKVEEFIEKVKSIKEQDGEEEYPTISKPNEIQNLKPDGGFIWGGETDNSYKFNGVDVVNGENEGEGLIKGMHYIVFPESEFLDEKGKTQIAPPSLAGLGALKPVVEGESKGFLRDLNKFIVKYKLNYVLSALGILSVTGGVGGATAAAASDFITTYDVESSGGAQQGELKTSNNIPNDFVEDAQNKVQGIETQDSPTTDSGELSKDLSQMGVDINIDITDDANTSTEILTHDSGEYEKTDAEKQAAAKSLTEKLLDDINKTLETKEGQNLESINLTVSYGGSISYQGGEDSQKATDGSDLLKGRVLTSLDIATIAIDDVERIIAETYGQDFVDNNLNIGLNEVNTEGGVENQKVQQTGDNLSTQSSFQSINIDDIKTGDTGKPITLLQYQFAAVVPSQPTPFISPPPETFGNLIREGQITSIMGLIKPEILIFPFLNIIRHGKEENEPLGGYTQSDWVKVRDNESLPQESRTLAGVIINARKSPDTLTSRIADCLGVELTKRQLVKQTRPGAAATPQFVRITEILHPLYELLSEAAIDDFIDCSNVNKHGGQLLSYLNSMYAASANPYELGIEPVNLPSNLKGKMDKFGFKPSTVGRDNGIYVFMGKGTQDNISKPISLDPNIQVAKDKGAIPSSTLDIDSKPFKDGKIFISPKDVPVFPKDLYNTQFYKDAVKDGWVFVDRKDASSLPKGTKVKTFKLNLKNLKNIDYNRNKKLITLLENKKKMKKSLLTERLQELAGIKIIKEEEEDIFNQDTKTVSGLANQFLEVSKKMRRGEYKGLQSGEINEIDDLIAMILQGAMDGNITPILQRLEAMAIKTVKDTGDKLNPTDDLPDETI